MPRTARLVVLSLLALLCVAAAQDMAEESRSKRRRAIVPLLMGVVLKVSTLLPMSLMVLTFLAVSALITAKLALGLIGTVGASFLIHDSHHGHVDLTDRAAVLPLSPLPKRRRIIIT